MSAYPKHWHVEVDVSRWRFRSNTTTHASTWAPVGPNLAVAVAEWFYQHPFAPECMAAWERYTEAQAMGFHYGMDGHGNRHLDINYSNRVVFCVPADWCLESAIDTIRNQYARE